MSLSTNTTYRVFLEKLGGTDPASFVGDAGELFFDPSIPALKLSDGSTPGGIGIGTTSGGSSGLQNIVEDTTPQLGGNLDTNGRSIIFGNASISETSGEVSIGYTGEKLKVTADGVIELPGATYYKSTGDDVLVAGSSGSPTVIDVTRGVALLSDNLGVGTAWYLGDSFSGAVMHFVAIQSNDPTSLNIVGNFVSMSAGAVTEQTGSTWYPFSDANTSSSTIATAIFYDGDKNGGGVYPVGWRISGGTIV
jgi:hypothetical protein